MPVTITIILKQEDSTYRQKFLNYQDDNEGLPIVLEEGNHQLKNMVDECYMNCKLEPEEIIIKTEMSWPIKVA